MGRLIRSVLTNSILLSPLGRTQAAVTIFYLLLETGDFALLETGDKIILE